MQWESDLIGYDALSSYGSPSYWAQVMFAGHIGTEIVSTSLADAGPRVSVSATRDDSKRKLYIKLVNGTSDVKRVAIALGGVPAVKGPAKLISMSGKSPNSTNTLEHPEAIKPVEHAFSIASPKFEHSFESYSINVIELSY
jgi:alpha-N-arabinofuranosidase